MDDYGHHPEEIRVTLLALKEAWPDRRLVVLFQPHRYSRTVQLGEAFHTAFYDSDVLFLAPIYAAGEDPIAGVSSKKIGEGIRAHGHKFCEDVNCLTDGARRISLEIKSGDLVLTLGAGDVWKVGKSLLDMEQKKSGRTEKAG